MRLLFHFFLPWYWSLTFMHTLIHITTVILLTNISNQLLSIFCNSHVSYKSKKQEAIFWSIVLKQNHVKANLAVKIDLIVFSQKIWLKFYKHIILWQQKGNLDCKRTCFPQAKANFGRLLLCLWTLSSPFRSLPCFSFIKQFAEFSKDPNYQVLFC